MSDTLSPEIPRVHLGTFVTPLAYRTLRGWRALPVGIRAYIVAVATHRAACAVANLNLQTKVLDLRGPAALLWFDGKWMCTSASDGSLVTVCAARDRLGLVAEKTDSVSNTAGCVVVVLVTGASVTLDLGEEPDPTTESFFRSPSCELPPGVARVHNITVLQGAPDPFPVFPDTGGEQTTSPDSLLSLLRDTYLEEIGIQVSRTARA